MTSPAITNVLLITCALLGVLGLIWLGGILEEIRREAQRSRVVLGKIQWRLGQEHWPLEEPAAVGGVDGERSNEV